MNKINKFSFKLDLKNEQENEEDKENKEEDESPYSPKKIRERFVSAMGK